MAKTDYGFDDAAIDTIDRGAGGVVNAIDAFGNFIFGTSTPKPEPTPGPGASHRCTCKCECTCKD